MTKTVFLSLGLILFAYPPLFGQFQPAERVRERRDRMIRAEQERERRKEDAAKVSPDAKSKAAVMNVDVRVVLSRSEYKTFAEAQLNAVTRVADGEPLWLNIKFNGKLGDYVFVQPDKEDPGRLRYMLFTEIGPQGDVTALTQFTLQFSAAELAATELKINLAPGIYGKNKTIPVLLKTADAASPGVWRNEFRISNSSVNPRGPNDFLAKSSVVLDLSGSHAKYRQMWAEFDSVMLRGTPDILKMPILGTFFNDAVKKEVETKLAAAAIAPAKFYFSGDDWGEIATSAYSLLDSTSFSVKKQRRVFATYTYQKFGSCLYGVAEVTQAYDEPSSKFLTAEIDLKNDFPIPCELLK